MKYICTGCPESAVRGCKLNFWKKNFQGGGLIQPHPPVLIGLKELKGTKEPTSQESISLSLFVCRFVGDRLFICIRIRREMKLLYVRGVNSNPFYKVTCYIKLDTASWTDGISDWRLTRKVQEVLFITT